MSDYRDDPRWQEAHERLTAEPTDETPDARLFRTVQAAFDLRAIERGSRVQQLPAEERRRIIDALDRAPGLREDEWNEALQ